MLPSTFPLVDTRGCSGARGGLGDVRLFDRSGGRLDAEIAHFGIFPVEASMAVNREGPGKDPEDGELDEIGRRFEVAVVRTRTPPLGSRRVDVESWGDLVRAAEFLGKPILRLVGGAGGPEGRLLYVLDGPISYVFDFGSGLLNTARSGAYALSPHTQTSPAVDLPVPPEPELRPEVPDEKPLGPIPLPASVSAPIPVPAPERPETPERPTPAELSAVTKVEQQIRVMVHDIMERLRSLPPEHENLERGVDHVQMALDLLRERRFGAAQMELNKASRLIAREDEPDPGDPPSPA